MKTEQVLVHSADNNKKLNKITAAAAFSIVLILFLFCLYSEKVNRSLSGNMIRLHIVANSDSKADQDIKYLIRDEIVSHMMTIADQFKSKDDAKAYIQNNIEEFENIVNKAIAHSGQAYKAKVSYGKYPFPSKRYNNIILPAGYYDSVKIDIGKAEGENWWCVMFPPLCFVNETKGEMDNEYFDMLKNKLSEDEMSIIMAASDSEEIPVEIRFKIVELFQQSKIKLANLFRGIIRLN
ncbi:MAG: stage II sporulation protein R [Clostridiaceae bacterium]|nr:stage II sporulation protein R [Clostridiaceae bacterium]